MFHNEKNEPDEIERDRPAKKRKISRYTQSFKKKDNVAQLVRNTAKAAI